MWVTLQYWVQILYGGGGGGSNVCHSPKCMLNLPQKFNTSFIDGKLLCTESASGNTPPSQAVLGASWKTPYISVHSGDCVPWKPCHVIGWVDFKASCNVFFPFFPQSHSDQSIQIFFCNASWTLDGRHCRYNLSAWVRKLNAVFWGHFMKGL